MNITRNFYPTAAVRHASQGPQTIIPLSMACSGSPMRLVKINAGCSLTHRLTELGFTLGEMITIVQDSGGPLLISLRGSRLAIGRDLAQHLMVIPVPMQIQHAEGV